MVQQIHHNLFEPEPLGAESSGRTPQSRRTELVEELEIMEKIIVQKLNMTQIWQNDKVVPVTILRLRKKDDKTLLTNLKEGDVLKITGRSKGKGFQGVVKRHGFAGGPKSHGQKDRLRAPGSIGSTALQRTAKGRKMAGHMGMKKVTLKKVKLIKILNEEEIMIKGPIPGMRGSLIEIKK